MTTKRIAGLLLAISVIASCSKSVDPRAENFARLPDWRGVWIEERGFDVGISGIPDFFGKTRPFLDPEGPWNDAGRERLASLLTNFGARKAQGWGYPMMMLSPAPLQFLVTPDETLIVNIYQEVRHIYTDGRGHPSEQDRWATTWGDSIGHWEGDTLVIDTLSVREPSKFFQAGPPFSEQARYSERLRLTAPGRIEGQITVEDPQTLTKSWTYETAYLRTPNIDRLVQDTFDNDRSEVENGAFIIAPAKP